MYYRSTNAEGRFVHYGGALVAGVEFGSGIELNPTSSGGVARIQPAGDESNKDIALLGKGTGGVFLGSTAATALAFRGAFSSTSTWSAGATSSGQPVELTFANTVFDVNPGDLIGAIEVYPTASTTPLAYLHYRTSTAATSRLTVALGNIASTATSTTSGHIRVTWLDLTA